jgi:hypothetical protein
MSKPNITTFDLTRKKTIPAQAMAPNKKPSLPSDRPRKKRPNQRFVLPNAKLEARLKIVIVKRARRRPKTPKPGLGRRPQNKATKTMLETAVFPASTNKR